jgi:hypothetical protein
MTATLDEFLELQLLFQIPRYFLCIGSVGGLGFDFHNYKDFTLDKTYNF